MASFHPRHQFAGTDVQDIENYSNRSPYPMLHLLREASVAKLGVVSCSFCGKSQQEVRSLIEGGCRHNEISPCVFICDECVALCAHINAEAKGLE